jgi:hypothetical protein
MSYIPDYRKETDKLNEVDKAYINGYRRAVESLLCAFDNLDDKNALSVEKEITERLKDSLEEWMECDEIEVVYSLFDDADYLPDDIELVDANKEGGFYVSNI